jgi:HAD superfamily hydrolase (TIGR01509 family)
MRRQWPGRATARPDTPGSLPGRKNAAVADEVELVIFDCDGVLVDSEVISNDVLARALTAQGLPTTLAEARRDYQGLRLAEVLTRAQAKLGRPLPKNWLARYERERASAFRRALKPVAGAAAAVELISEAGVAVCVASQGALEKTRLSLALTGLDRLFADHELFSAESVARGKPHPDLFLHAAAAMSAEPARSVVVEDTATGVMAARAAGMRAFGFIADSDEAALQAAGAERLGAMSKLPQLLGIG